MRYYRRFIYYCVCIGFLLLGLSLPSLGQTRIDLTPEEKSWLADHPKIVVGGETDWAPFDFVDKNGKYTGLANDYLKIIGERLGIKVEMVTGPHWNELLGMLRRKEIDVLPAIYHSAAREDFVLFTSAYIQITEFIFSRSGNATITRFEDLQDKTTVVVKSYTIENYMRSNHPEFNLTTAPTIQEALKKLVTGEADAFIGDIISTSYNIKELSLVGLKPIAQVPIRGPEVHMGVRTDWPILRGLIDKAFAAMSASEHDAIKENWIAFAEKKISASRPEVALTAAEQAWINQHPVIRVHNETASPPFNFAEHGRAKGFSIDYMRLLAEKIGLQVEFVTGPTWDAFLGMMKSGDLDVMLNIAKTTEREAYLAYTPEYVTLTQTLYTRDDFPLVRSIEDLYGKRIAVPKGFYIAELLKPYPQVEIVEVRDIVEAIHAVSVGKADALYDIMPAVNYLMNKHQITNLKVGGDLGIEAGRPMPLHLAVPKKDAILAGILAKGMALITNEEYRRVSDRWLGRAVMDATGLGLTDGERVFLSAHPVIRVHNEKDWPPFNYFEYGRSQGLSIDYMNLLAARLGIEVEYVTGPSWNEFLDMVQRQELDVMLNIVRTEDRQRYLLFTEPYVQNPNVIVSTIEQPYENIQALFGRTVAFPRGFFFEEVLTQSFPQIKRLPVEDSLASLKAVMFGRADAALAEAAVARTLITKNLLTGLRISGEVDIGDPELTRMRIGIRDDWPLLHTALMKAMADVSLEEMTQIRQRWITDEVDTATPRSTVPVSYGRLMAYGLAVFGFLCLLTWVLIRVLKREQVAVQFGSRWFRGLVIAGLSLFVVVVSLLGWFVLERSRTKILSGVGEDLTETLKIANQKLDLWLDQGTSALGLLGREPDLVVLTQRLVAVPANRGALEASTALRGVRNFFKTNEEMFANSGFYIFDRNNLTIGALQDTDLGKYNRIARKRPDLLQRAFAGELLFVPPITAESHLASGPAPGAHGDRSLTFFMGPIREPGGRVLAVMALRVNPSEDLLRLLPFARTRETGETYAFSADGDLLSESRFEAQLRRIGLIREDQSSILNVVLKDPGVNLLDGHSPAVERAELPLTRMASRVFQIRNAMQQAGQTSGHSKIEIDTEGYRDYRGVPVFGTWLWHASLGVGLATEIDVTEAMAAYYQIRWTVFGVLGFTLVLSVGAILMVLVLGERASRALLTARDNLEARVDERTAELQEKQDQLVEAEERARLLLDSAGEGIFGVDVDGRLAFINPAGCRMLGYEPDELVGEGIHAKVHYAHADGTPYPREECPMYLSCAEGTSSRITDEVLWCKDGTPFPVEYTSMPLHKDGEVVGAVVTFMDISERKRMGAKLAAEQERLQGILDTSPVSVGISVEGVIQYANAHLVDFFGTRQGDHTIDIYVNPEDRDIIVKELEKTGTVRSYELKVYNVQGEVCDVLSNYNAIEYEGQQAILSWWIDITEIKATSEELKSKFDELARFRQMAIGRELKMIELKKEINDLVMANGAPEKYKIH